MTILVAPQYLSNGSLLGTNCLEPNLWMGCAYFAILAIKRNDPRNWLWFGVVAGLGMEEKYSIALFGLGIVVGLLLTEQRRVFANKWIWLGGLAAFLVFLPNLLWNVHYHWPFVELMRNIRAEGRDVVLPPLQYFFQQTLLVLPLTAPIWITGLVALFFSQRLKIYRVLGWSYLVCYTVFFVLHGKNYYLAPIYPMLLAAGAVTIENAFDRPRLSLDETGNRGGAARGRRTPCPSGCAGSVSGPIHCLHEISAHEVAGDGTRSRARSSCRSGTPTSLDGKRSWPKPR